MRFYPALASLLLLSFVSDAFADDQAKSAAMRLGRMKAMACAGCHGMDGKGLERDGQLVAPGYADSAILKGDPDKLALIILKGIKKDSERYSAAMGGMEAAYDDRSLAAVMTWVRNQWGGHDDYITAEEAAKFRERFADRTEPISLGEIAVE